ncbi:MAG: molybdenum cofactor biosynthesis protein B [Gemmatimonadota bacterium]
MSAEMAQLDRRAAVLTVSDRVTRGEVEDSSGPALAARLEEAGWKVIDRAAVADDDEAIAAALSRFADEGVALVLTTGGTGIAPRDVTPDATRRVIDREVTGIAEALRAASLAQTPHAMLSRATAGVRGATLIVNLPGSPKAVAETFSVLAPVLDHAARLLRGEPVSATEHQARDRS